MKAILVVDMPKSCEECPLRSYSDLMLMCTPMRESASDVECPLKPMPNRIDWFENGYNGGWIMFSTGWNACIEEIEK